MVLIYPKVLWRNFVNVSISGLMFRQWLTPNLMVKLKEQARKLKRSQAPAYRSFTTDARLLGRGVTLSIVEHQYNPQQVNGLHTFLHGLRSRGGSP